MVRSIVVVFIVDANAAAAPTMASVAVTVLLAIVCGAALGIEIVRGCGAPRATQGAPAPERPSSTMPIHKTAIVGA